MEFNAYNIMLPDGTRTAPAIPANETNPVCLAALRSLKLMLPDGGTVWDLGCLEGGYALEFARAGYNTTGIEVNDVNMECCRFIKEQCWPYDTGLEFVQEDVRNMADLGQCDVVFCAGLLYHLDDPVGFLDLIGRVARKGVIIQTHVSLAPDAERDGYEGHWYQDTPGERWGSHGNETSFWLSSPDLMHAIREAGFDFVARQYDYLPDIRNVPLFPTPDTPHGGQDRLMALGIKTG